MPRLQQIIYVDTRASRMVKICLFIFFSCYLVFLLLFRMNFSLNVTLRVISILLLCIQMIGETDADVVMAEVIP